MKHVLAVVFLLLSAQAWAACLPKEAGGTGTAMQLHFVDEGTVWGWRCAGVFEWVGTRKQEFIPHQQEDLLIRQLQQLRATQDPVLREGLRRAANSLEARTK